MSTLPPRSWKPTAARSSKAPGPVTTIRTSYRSSSSLIPMATGSSSCAWPGARPGSSTSLRSMGAADAGERSSMTARFRVSAWAGSGPATVAAVTGAVRDAADAGFDGVWLPQTLSVDALSALAVAASQVPDIHVGTAVVPLQGRHPFPLAQQALTAADAAGPGRFALGVGVTHAFVSETFYGFPYRDAVALCREELQALAGLLGPDRKVNVAGRFVVTQVGLTMQGPSPSVVVAALGPKMLELAGELSDGTVT